MHLLVIRTSSMGDVALVAPVLKSLNEQYSDAEVTFITRKSFAPFFISIKGIKLFFPDFRNRHKGIIGLLKLYYDVTRNVKFDYVIDLHNVIRTRFLDFLFLLSGTHVKIIDKGRKEKKALITGKKKEQLKHSVERYMQVFEEAGFRLVMSKGPWIVPPENAAGKAEAITGITSGLNIGVAPFAKHELKMWPEENMITLLSMISKKARAKFWLFGGIDEDERLRAFQARVDGSVKITGKLTLEEELALISRLDFMIAMDSSNMHMAALTGTKVISIWGATDPVTGFGAWQQPEEYSVRISLEELTCRPCTVYGKGECWRGDHACMEWLAPKMVFDRIKDAGLLP